MTTKVILLVLTIIVSSLTISAYYTYNYDNNHDLRLEVEKYLDSVQLRSDGNQPITIHYLVNLNHEIVVLSTSTQEFENQIKNVLNYKAIKTTNVEVNKIYTLPIKIGKK